ncbi:unnamed protein product [Caenorhabditis sp. 36 PRJEB53466]|nr:unnamed protein product [Caenorhabditis sp. 36 PRJEB53466]
MRLLLTFCSILVFYLPIRKKTVYSQPQGIDSEEGDAEIFFNRTYSQHQTSLEQKIFRGYNMKNRPVKNASLPTIVDVHWHIIHVSINAKEQTMTVHGHIYMKWFDEYLVWDPKDFSGIHYARVKKWQVWQPKIKVANSASGLGSVFDFSTSAHVIIQMQESKAKVEMYPTFSIKVGCAFDFTDFPNDENKCSMNLFSTLPMSEVQLQNLYSIPPTLSFGWEEQKMKRIISDFKIQNVSSESIYYSNGNVSSSAPVSGYDLSVAWSMLKVNVKFVRHSPLFVAGIAAPCLITALINILSFFIPTLPFTCYILMANQFIQMVFLQDMVKKLPLTVRAMPSSVKLYCFIMLFNAISLFLHFVFIFLTEHKTPVPEGFRIVYVLKGYLPATWKEKDVIKDEEKEGKWQEWLKVVRPLIGTVLAFVYFIQILVYIVL